VVLEQDQTLPVFNPIAQGVAAQILLTPDLTGDAGFGCTVFGSDSTGATVWTTRQDGTKQEGETVTLAATGVYTTNSFTRVDRILKPLTNGPVTAQQLLPDGSLLPLAHYEPGETSPEYLSTRIRGLRHNQSIPSQQVVALVKLKYVPAAYDQDIIAIDNRQALKFAVQAMKHNDATQIGQQQQDEAAAIRELNLQLADCFPEDSIPFKYEEFAGQSFHNHCF
jgi:hypothetical protein